MHRSFNILIIILLVVILLFLTNPSKDQFVNWAVQQASNQADSKLESILGNMIGKPLLQMSSSRQDYFLFSIFTVQHNDQQEIYLGLLKKVFIEIDWLDAYLPRLQSK